MFCPNCGAKCEDDAFFCESCGTSLAEVARELAAEQPEQTNGNVQEKEQPETEAFTPAESGATTVQQPEGGPQFNGAQGSGQPMYGQPVQGSPMYGQPMPQKPKKSFKMPKALIAVLAAAAVIIIAAVVFVSVGLSATNYRKTAEKYVKAYVSGDYEKAYDYMNVPESEFLSLEAYKQVNAGTKTSEVSEIEAKDAYSYKDSSSIVKEVDVKYTLKNGGSDYTYLNMEKTNGSYLLFFKKYKVSVEDTIAKNVIIKVPAGMKLSLNGVEVSEQYVKEEYKNKSTGYVYYEIPYLFLGGNKVVVSGDNIEEYSEEMDVAYDEQSCYISNSDLKVKDNVLNTLKEQAKQDLEKIAAAGLENKEFSEISSLAAATYKNKAESSYRSDVKNTLHSNSREVSELKINDIKTSINSTSYQISTEGLQYVKVSVSYSLTGKYAYKNFDSEPREGTGKSSSASITYAYEDGKWSIATMNLDFYIY